MPLQSLGDFRVDVLNRCQCSLALIALLIAITQFDRFMLTGGCSRRHGRAAHGTIGKIDIRFNRRIAARIEDFGPLYSQNCCQEKSSFRVVLVD